MPGFKAPICFYILKGLSLGLRNFVRRAVLIKVLAYFLPEFGKRLIVTIVPLKSITYWHVLLLGQSYSLLHLLAVFWPLFVAETSLSH